MKTLNEAYSKLSMRRRYEVWFLRLGLADGSGAWWFRYLLMSPGREECGSDPRQQPVQIWATWFPRHGKPQTWIEAFSPQDFRLSTRSTSPLVFEAGENRISENECRGRLEVDGHRIGWDLRYRSTFRVELSSKGWIGFSRTPHSDAIFSGEITLDGQTFRAEPLGYGMQGHNCGYRHRKFWAWTHIHFPSPEGSSTTLEALVYEMPLGLTFRKAVIWHEGREHVFRSLQDMQRDPSHLLWHFFCLNPKVSAVRVEVQGRKGLIHHLPYLKTDCSGQFEVANDSMATARMTWYTAGVSPKGLSTDTGAVIEMAGRF
ncbi:MAG TPA: hypothetical protein VJN89_14815 [Candidatus Acidoferrum sp.]|nr:hypothetical protein [Candidatus Acidoferrum sp.]